MATMTELLFTYNELATAAGKATRKGFDSKAKAEAAIAALTPTKGGMLKVRKARKSAEVNEQGPRGFKFGPVWLQSIRDGVGVALRPQNLPKLIATAQHHTVEISEDLSQAEIAKAIAKAL